MKQWFLWAWVGVICLPIFAQPSPNGQAAAALTNWQAALSSFQKAGAFIGQAKYPQAKAELTSAATNLPAPYQAMAGQYLERLEAGLKQSSKEQHKEQL